MDEYKKKDKERDNDRNMRGRLIMLGRRMFRRGEW